MANEVSQLQVQEQHRHASIVAVSNPTNCRVDVLAFQACRLGARSVVWAFKWSARSFQWRACTDIALAVTHYFDNFSFGRTSCNGHVRRVDSRLAVRAGWFGLK